MVEGPWDRNWEKWLAFSKRSTPGFIFIKDENYQRCHRNMVMDHPWRSSQLKTSEDELPTLQAVELEVGITNSLSHNRMHHFRSFWSPRTKLAQGQIRWSRRIVLLLWKALQVKSRISNEPLMCAKKAQRFFHIWSASGIGIGYALQKIGFSIPFKTVTVNNERNATQLILDDNHGPEFLSDYRHRQLFTIPNEH